jgi:hypothetical protein
LAVTDLIGAEQGAEPQDGTGEEEQAIGFHGLVELVRFETGNPGEPAALPGSTASARGRWRAISFPFPTEN